MKKKVDINDFGCISMGEFLAGYVNCADPNRIDDIIPIDKIEELKRKRATHIDITILGIPYIKRVPNDIVTLEQLSRGDIILVEDFKSKNGSRKAPYLRPSLVYEQELRKQRKAAEDAFDADYYDDDNENDFDDYAKSLN